jgi:hypothetical protein
MSVNITPAAPLASMRIPLPEQGRAAAPVTSGTVHFKLV